MSADAASRIPINYDEEAVPEHELPDPLHFEDGSPVGAAAWPRRRREILRLFEDHVYGRIPGPPSDPEIATAVEVVEEGALGDWATRRQISLTWETDRHLSRADILLYLPASRSQPVPVFAGLNFFGNQTVQDDPAILLTDSWVRSSDSLGIEDNRANDRTRGTLAHRWQVELILSRGFGLATAYCGDFDPDFDDGFRNGVHPLYSLDGQTGPAPGDWGTIGAWAWGLCRVCDYLETDAGVDANRVAVMGHSRLGKTALWAGACDERFAMVVSNNSGCGGAALSRRRYGENVAFINTRFPHWFCDRFRRYNGREEELPVDQHMLIALAAPRPVYVASAAEDLWADPRGEFLACANADPVYRLLGTDGLPSLEMPAVNSPLHGGIGYHLREGGHDVLRYDWEQYLDFADRHLGD